MEPLLTSEQIRALDSHTISEIGIPEVVLLEHAALSVSKALGERFGKSLSQTKGLVLAGPGKNGADALACVRLIQEKGCESVGVVLIEGRTPAQLSPLTAMQLSILGKLGMMTTPEFSKELLAECDWIIDGIFGTGLQRPLDGKVLDIINQVNAVAAQKWIVAVDIPSGLNADTGRAMPTAIQASETVSFGFLKKGLLTSQAADFVGQVRVAPIQIPRLLPFPVDAFWFKKEDVSRLPLRKKTSHKGDFGHVWIVLGTHEKEGASLLSCLGALKSGAGLVTLLGEKAELDRVRPRLPMEVMTDTLNKSFFGKAKQGACVIGPGLGLEAWEWLKLALESRLALVLDADALTLLSNHDPEAESLLMKRKDIPTVLTPHPKEASRLLKRSVEEVEADRFQAVKTLSEKMQCLVLLKGKGTCVRGPLGPTFVMTEGDSGLSKGGSGDLLSGVIASQFLQGLSPQQAVLLSAYLHGRASELLTQKTGSARASLPSEIAQELTHAFSELEESKT